MRVLYVSYDGALDPLGATQVVPYLVGLANAGVELTLVSFEKPVRGSSEQARAQLEARLQAAGVRWVPLTYHRRPRLPATLWDVVWGALALRSEHGRRRVDLVHCRGDVAMAISRAAGLACARLYDVRGLFADERLESGSWKAGGLTDRLARRIEAANLRAATGVVVLTNAARATLAKRRPFLTHLRVIPTCVDLARFVPRRDDVLPDYGVVYSGSLGTWYMTTEMVDFARAASPLVGGRALFLTPQLEQAVAAGISSDWAEARTVPPDEVPSWLRRARAAFFFVRPTPAKRASCPTKLAEALACGLPVVANRGIGDIDELLEAQRIGVFVDGFGADAYRSAARRLRELLDDRETPRRCRRVAEEKFSLTAGVAAYHELYRAISA